MQLLSSAPGGQAASRRSRRYEKRYERGLWEEESKAGKGGARQGKRGAPPGVPRHLRRPQHHQNAEPNRRQLGAGCEKPRGGDGPEARGVQRQRRTAQLPRQGSTCTQLVAQDAALTCGRCLCCVWLCVCVCSQLPRARLVPTDVIIYSIYK